MKGIKSNYILVNNFMFMCMFEPIIVRRRTLYVRQYSATYAWLIHFTRHEYGIRYEWQNFN